MKRKTKRGPAPGGESEFIGVWIPKALAALLDRAVQRMDSDRSKVLRAAVREKLDRVS